MDTKSDIKSINDVVDLKGKRVFVRFDFNVPIVSGKIEESFRIDKAIPTIKFLQEKGAKIIAASHIESDETESLKLVFEYLKKFFDIRFISDYSDESLSSFSEMKDGDIVLLENLRMDAGEKTNDENFAKKLASLADIYVNDAFAVSHRKHASVVGVPKYLPGYAGPLLMEEIRNLSAVFDAPKPFVFLLGGVKFSTKMPLVEKFLNIADKIFVGGALANDFFKAQGFDVGKSVVSSEPIDLSVLLENEKIILPADVVVKNGNSSSIKRLNEVSGEDVIADIGPESVETQIKNLVKDAKFILWNGTMGHCEIGFKEGTAGTAKVVSESGAKSVVGGGDTVAAIKELGAFDRFSFISTGGGAMLDFLANETLPGIDALK